MEEIKLVVWNENQVEWFQDGNLIGLFTPKAVIKRLKKKIGIEGRGGEAHG